MKIKHRKYYIALFCLILFFTYYYVFYFDSFEKIEKSNLPTDVKLHLKNKIEYEDILDSLKNHDIKIEHRGLEYTQGPFVRMIKGDTIINFKDPIKFVFVSDDIAIIRSGPFTFDSGLRYFNPFKYSSVQVISLDNLKIIKRFSFRQKLDRCFISGDSLYLIFQNSYGIKKWNLNNQNN